MTYELLHLSPLLLCTWKQMSSTTSRMDKLTRFSINFSYNYYRDIIIGCRDMSSTLIWNTHNPITHSYLLFVICSQFHITNNVCHTLCSPYTCLLYPVLFKMGTAGICPLSNCAAIVAAWTTTQSLFPILHTFLHVVLFWKSNQ